MIINLTDILTSEDKTSKQQVSYEPDTFVFYGEEYSITSKEEFELTLTNMGKGKANIAGKGTIQVLIPCSRCLKEQTVSIPFTILENVSIEEIENPTDAEGFEYLTGYHLDTDKLIGNEIMMNWPMKVLCMDECKGICKQCGKDLNLGECECDTFVPDPRMAVIKDIFNANKEV